MSSSSEEALLSQQNLAICRLSTLTMSFSFPFDNGRVLKSRASLKVDKLSR